MNSNLSDRVLETQNLAWFLIVANWGQSGVSKKECVENHGHVVNSGKFDDLDIFAMM